MVNQPLNNENHSINRKEQKSVQTAYDTDVQKNDKYKMRHRINKVDNLEIVINLLHVILSQKDRLKRAKRISISMVNKKDIAKKSNR